MTVLVGTVLAGAVMGCSDPIQSKAEAALGPEDPGVSPGPLHRPGQPCAVCHSDAGGRSVFSFAGTVYDTPGPGTPFPAGATVNPVAGATINVVDSVGRKFATKSNCAGNFIVRQSEFEPNYPMWVTISRDDVERFMNTPIYREASCAACHADPANTTNVGHLHMIEDPTMEKVMPNQCP